MLEQIGSVDKIPEFIKAVKDKKKVLMGFGHRVYKNHDPRAKIVREIAEDVFSIVGRESLIDIAMERKKQFGDKTGLSRSSFWPSWLQL